MTNPQIYCFGSIGELLSVDEAGLWNTGRVKLARAVEKDYKGGKAWASCGRMSESWMGGAA